MSNDLEWRGSRMFSELGMLLGQTALGFRSAAVSLRVGALGLADTYRDALRETRVAVPELLGAQR